jgi:hypothetical protein
MRQDTISYTFAREEVLQAMLHSQGDLENAVDEMNSKWLQLFHDRLWPTDDNILQPVDEDPFMEDYQRATVMVINSTNINKTKKV